MTIPLLLNVACQVSREASNIKFMSRFLVLPDPFPRPTDLSVLNNENVLLLYEDEISYIVCQKKTKNVDCNIMECNVLF